MQHPLAILPLTTAGVRLLGGYGNARGETSVKKLWILLLAAACSFAPALAQEDDGSVIDAYKLYNEAVETGDAAAAYLYAEETYDRAMAEWGTDRVEVGYIAANYAEQLIGKKEFAKAIDVFQVCIEVLENHLPDAVADYTNCLFLQARLYSVEGKTSSARKGYKAVIEQEPYADGDLLMSRLVGKAYLYLAADEVPERVEMRTMKSDVSGKFRDTLNYALKALPLLTASEGADSNEVGQTRMLLGFYSEFDQEWELAYRQYYDAYRIFMQLYGEEDENTRIAYGRMKFSRMRGDFTLTPEDFPLDIGIQEGVGFQPRPDNGKNCYQDTAVGGGTAYFCFLDRDPPKYPSVATSKGLYGYLEVRYEVSEQGRVENPNVYTSWPGGVFDEVTLEAMKTWKFSEPVDAEGNPARASTRVWLMFMIE